jgi:DnaJ-class molecular chaperone
MTLTEADLADQTCLTCNGTGEYVECANDGTHGCSHIFDKSYECLDCFGTGTVNT